MLARLTVAALAAITLASASAAAAVSTPPANGPTSAQQAALVPADGAGPIPDRLSAPSLFELPAKLTRFYLYEHMQGLGWLDRSDSGDVGLLASSHDKPTYQYLPGSTSKAASLAPLIAIKSGLADYPLRHRTTRTAETSYTVVPTAGAQDLVSPIPAAAVLFGSALGGFGALLWRHHRRRVAA